MTQACVPHDDAALLFELEPTAGRALDEHLKSADEWYPHEYIPWGVGRDFDGVLGGEPWSPQQTGIDSAVRDGLLHNLLSEDNLPSYHHAIAQLFGNDGAWGAWVNQWTAEEGRHGLAIRDYLLVTRATDPVALEDARRAHVQQGYSIDYRGVVESLVYVTLQELATRTSYSNIRRKCGDRACDALLRRISQDENRHMLFYRTVLSEAVKIDPDRVLTACATVIPTFRSPGHAAPGFTNLALSMMRSGIYTPTCHHDDVVVPMMRFLGLFELTGLSPAGDAARERLTEVVTHSEARARRFASRD
ncbi:acyl-ACP desaturase [Streptomyces sp. HD]|uniref:acyl-ACP desaturase n=1 Tax=Streptomyces sp. HD TaxID=3020892 RepID=UPI00232EBFCA|nr:acyl-ACP desaturase [Streptomyces sp. HD]MDC0770737.1 acyl-ACP desaturase [Streptomyces sp. HD]